MSSWNLTHKGTEPVTPEDWNTVVDALDELDGRAPKKRMGALATFSGDGSTTDFVIAHGLGVAPDVALVGEGSADAVGNKWWEVDATNLTIHFLTAPPSGTDNVKLWWLVLKL
jgi:hypothetical protein